MCLSRRFGLVCRAWLHWVAVREGTCGHDRGDDIGIRKTVGSSPGTCVFDVVVTGHVLRYDRDLVSSFGE